MTAEQLSRQEVVYLGFPSCRGFCVLGEPTAYRFKQVFVDDGWNTVFNANISVGIDSNISFIAKHGLETVAVEFHSLCGAIAFRIEHTANFSHGFSVGIELERFLNDVSCLRVNYQFVIFNLISG